MSSASISEYILNVVKGVRNSCVTAETNAPRRSLNETAPCSKTATARPPSSTQPHATASDTRSGDQNDREAKTIGGVMSLTGKKASMRASLSPSGESTGCKSAEEKRSWTPVKSDCLRFVQLSQQP